jgi:putative transcriptional regulator
MPRKRTTPAPPYPERRLGSYLRVLVAQKELHERRRITVQTIADESGANRSAIMRLLNNTIREVPLEALELLCRWVPCGVEDILRFGTVVAQERDTDAKNVY